MELKDDGRHAFIDKDCDPNIFLPIFNQYRLEKRRSIYIPMNPQGVAGVVCVPENKMEDFFRNTQYREFATFKEINVGVNCHNQVSHGLENLQIPLPPPSYEVWVNGKPTGDKLFSAGDEYHATAPSTSFFSYQDVIFSLGELQAAQGNTIGKNGATIHLDSLKNRIDCTLKETPIKYNWVWEWNDNVGSPIEKIKKRIKSREIILRYGGKEINGFIDNPDGTDWSVEGDSRIVITPSQIDDGYQLQAHVRVDSNKHQIVGVIKVSEAASYKKVVPPVPPVIPPPHKDKRGIDIKSIIVGAVIGLIMGIVISGGISLLVCYHYEGEIAQLNKELKEKEKKISDLNSQIKNLKPSDGNGQQGVVDGNKPEEVKPTNETNSGESATHSTTLQPNTGITREGLLREIINKIIELNKNEKDTRPWYKDGDNNIKLQDIRNIWDKDKDKGCIKQTERVSIESIFKNTQELRALRESLGKKKDIIDSLKLDSLEKLLYINEKEESNESN